MFGISTETTSDLGGGLNVGYIHPNDWLSYAGKGIDAPVAGNYKVIFRVASPGGGGSFALHEADGSLQYGIVNVPNTGAWQQWVDVEKTIYLSAGKHSFGVAALTRGTGFNFNWFKVEFKGLALPVTIEAENYAAMYGVVTETTSDAGGGLNVGYIHPADWMSYANIKIDIPAAGSYRVTYRVASPATGGSFALHEADGSQQYDTVAVPATGGWQKWVDVERVITLSAGVHSLGITAITRGQGYNLNWFRLEALSSSGGAASAASSVTSSAAVSSSAAASSIKTLSSSSSSSSSVSSSSAASSVSGVGTIQVVGPVAFRWEIPTQRENGSRLDITELGGYELRYKRPTDSSFIYVSINDAWQNEYNFLWLEGEYIFQVAAFDKNGIYSNFVDIAPQ